MGAMKLIYLHMRSSAPLIQERKFQAGTSQGHALSCGFPTPPLAPPTSPSTTAQMVVKFACVIEYIQ